jgi:WD40 repeat protein
MVKMRFYWGLALIFVLASFIMPVWADSDEQPLLPDHLQVITLENVHQLERLATVGLGRIQKIIFSPDGDQLAVNTASKTYFYDMNDLSAPPRQVEGINKISSFSPDGKLLLAGNAVWDLETETLLYPFEGGKPFFTRDSAKLILNHDTEPQILDALTGQVLDVSLQDIGLTLRNETIYITRSGGIVEYGWGTWDEENGWIYPDIEETNVFLPQHGGGRDVSPDGTLVAESSWQGFAIWELETGQIVIEQDSWLYPSLTAPFFSRDSRFLAVGEANGKLFVYDRVKDHLYDTFYYGSSISFIDFNPDSSVMAVVTDNGHIHLTNTETWERLMPLDGFNPYPSTIHLDESDSLLSIVSNNGRLWRWDLKTGDFLHYDRGINFYVGRGTNPYPSAVDITPNAEIIASGSGDEGIIRLRTWMGESIRETDPQDNRLRTVESLDFSPDGTLLVAATTEGVKLFDASTLELVASAELAGEEITFSPDGQSIAVGTRFGEINILDSASLQPIMTIETVRNDINNLIFSPDATKIAITYDCYRCHGSTTPEEDFTIWVYDVVTGEIIQQLALDNTHAIGSITFSQDGNMLIALMVDKLAFWDLRTGELFHSIDKGGAFSHIMNQTGTMIFNYEIDGSVAVWSVRGD